MKCAINTCDQQSYHYRQYYYAPYCQEHNQQFASEWAFCFVADCNSFAVGCVESDKLCAKHGGKDYTPRTEEETKPEAIKHDQDKPRFDLLDPLSLSVVVRVFTFGAKKYADHNYLLGNGLDHGRVYASIQRHLNAYWGGEDNDPETSLPHLAHAACGAFMLLSLTLRKKGKDTRLKP